MRRASVFFCVLASAVWLAASSAAQTVNIFYQFSDFQTNALNVSQVLIAPIPTNGMFGGSLLLQYFPTFTRANTPTLTNGYFTLSNAIQGVVYKTTFTARGGDQTYYIYADPYAISGSTIGAWTNTVSPTPPSLASYWLFGYSQSQANGRFLFRAGDTAANLTNGGPSLATNWQSAVDGQALVKRGTNLDLETISGGSGGSATNAYQSQVGNNLLTIATNTSTLVYTFSPVAQTNANMQLWGAMTPTAYSNGFFAIFGTAAFRPLTDFQPAAANLTDWAKWGTNAYADVVSNRTVSGLGSAALQSSAAFDAAGAGTTAATMATNALGTMAWQLITAFITPAQQSILSNNLDADKLVVGTVPLARFGLSAPASAHTNFLLFKSDGSWIGYDLASLLGLTGGGSGTVTSVDVAEQGYGSSGAVNTSGTVTLTQNADKNHLGFSETNINKFAATNSAMIGGPFIDPTNVLQVNTLGGSKALQVGTNAVIYGNGAGLTNLLHSSTTSAGANISTTLSQNADGSTNTQVALLDPASLSQLNAGTGWITNTVTPTNAFAGTVVDFSKSEGTTNLGGNLTFSAVSGVTAGVYNATILHIYPGGADRTIAFPGNFHVARGNTSVVSNAFNHSDFLFTVQPSGFSTNVAQIDYP